MSAQDRPTTGALTGLDHTLQLFGQQLNEFAAILVARLRLVGRRHLSTIDHAKNIVPRFRSRRIV